MKFEELIAQQTEHRSVSQSEQSVLSHTEKILADMGYNDFSGCDYTGGRIVLFVSGVEDYLIRCATQPPEGDYSVPGTKESRSVIPQMTQPIFAKKYPGSEGIVIEILPWRKKRVEDPAMIAEYLSELKKCRHSYTKTWTDEARLELYEFSYYDDKKHCERIAPIAVDPGEVSDGWSQPRCTANYPTLDAQWREQCRIVEKDERLQRLLGAKAPPLFPPTRIIDVPDKSAESMRL